MQDDAAPLQNRAEHLQRLARHLAASSALQGLRAGARASETEEVHRQLRLMQSSTIWRATWPVRVCLDLARGGSAEAGFVKRLMRVMRKQGIRAGMSHIRDIFARRAARRVRAQAVPGFRPTEKSLLDSAILPPNRLLAPSVLIIAELTLPQCAKYRVWQKQEHFDRLGVRCRVVDWRHKWECLSAASLATQIILYRVPAYPTVLQLIEHVHSLRIPVAWEVDDLIFDNDLFLKNRNVDELDEELRESITSGVELYRSAMLACGAGIASTPCLARIMAEAGLREVAVVENALDHETLSVAQALRESRHLARVDPGRGDAPQSVLITYGSGTKTHDADFRQVSAALLRLLASEPRLRLRIVGELKLEDSFEAFAGRIERFPPSTFPRYLQLLSEGDISIAPLEPTLFNDTKSNIKFLEAAILALPSVCSPRAHFTDVITHGENGLLAESEDQWFATLAELVDDASLRARLGEAALSTALQKYDPAAIGRSQVVPLLANSTDLRRPAQLRVLFANIYYAPRSFGGATLVVQEMARRLHARADTEVHVVTSLAPEAPDPAITRTQQDGITLFSLPVAEGDAVAEFDNPTAGLEFGQILDAVQPDVVHLHAVQWLSASLATACMERNIPYVITLHDAWWLCARQFMVQENGRYCFQTKIDLHVCETCMPGARHLRQRDALLRTALDGAALLLSPSEAHRKLYLANGIPSDKIEVAPNGVRMPQVPPQPRIGRPVLRFAYVGGDVEVKGFSLVKAAFQALKRADWELVIVDNTQKLGFSSMSETDWGVAGKVIAVPAYGQDEMDAFFADIDVLLFPSQWKESFGLTVREALVRNVWVIATAGGGPGEAITDGVNGTLIPLDGRHESLLAAINNLLDDPERLAGYTNKRAAEVLDYDAQASALHATLTRVVAQHRATYSEH